MGSMDTSRIGQFLGWASKATAAADTYNPQSGGFGDLLLGVMSRRQQTQLLPGKVSTVLPIGEAGAATHRIAPERPAPSARAASEAGSSDPQAVKSRGAETSGGKQTSNVKSTSLEDKVGIEETSELAASGETGEPDSEAGDEIDLPSDSSGAAGGETAGDGTDQPSEQTTDQAIAAVIDTQLVADTAPASALDTASVDAVAATTQANGAAGTAPDIEAANCALAPAVPAATTPSTERMTADTAAAANTDTDSETPAETATKVVNQATDAALSMAGETLATEADAAAGVASRQSDRRGEDQAGQFRRAAQPARQRTDAAGAGPAGAAAQSAVPTVARTANGAGLTATSTPPGGVSTLLQPIDPEVAFGNVAGMPMNMHLLQNVARRSDFLANLRQGLQNLPAHDQVALGIQRAARDGGGSISLQLSPSELGRIHVKLDIDDEKNVRANVSVERPATLDLLLRDMKALERALQDAGLKMDQGNLSFSLHRGGEESLAREFGAGGNAGGPFLADVTDEDLPVDVPQAAIIATGDGLVDVQI